MTRPPKPAEDHGPSPTEHLPGAVPRPLQLQFGMGGLLLVMLICSLLAAGVYYLVRSVRSVNDDRSSQLLFLAICFCAPAALVVVVSAVHFWYRRRTPGDFNRTETNDV